MAAVVVDSAAALIKNGYKASFTSHKIPDKSQHDDRAHIGGLFTLLGCRAEALVVSCHLFSVGANMPAPTREFIVDEAKKWAPARCPADAHCFFFVAARHVSHHRLFSWTPIWKHPEDDVWQALWRSSISEFFATLIFVYIGTGSVIATQVPFPCAQRHLLRACSSRFLMWVLRQPWVNLQSKFPV